MFLQLQGNVLGSQCKYSNGYKYCLLPPLAKPVITVLNINDLIIVFRYVVRSVYEASAGGKA